VAITLFFLLPEGKVFLKELDDALGISELVLLELVDLVESVLEGLISELDGLLGVLHGLVVEDREVEGESELDGRASGQLDVHGFLVGLEGVLLDGVKSGALSILSHVAVVVADHLDKEALGFVVVGSLGEDVLSDHVNDFLAVLLELGLNGGLVASKGVTELGVLGVLLDRLDSATSGAFGADEVLERNGEEVPLVGANISTLVLEDLLKELNHVFEALGLFGNTGKEYVLFNAHLFLF